MRTVLARRSAHGSAVRRAPLVAALLAALLAGSAAAAIPATAVLF